MSPKALFKQSWLELSLKNLATHYQFKTIFETSAYQNLSTKFHILLCSESSVPVRESTFFLILFPKHKGLLNLKHLELRKLE